MHLAHFLFHKVNEVVIYLATLSVNEKLSYVPDLFHRLGGLVAADFFYELHVIEVGEEFAPALH